MTRLPSSRLLVLLAASLFSVTACMDLGSYEDDSAQAAVLCPSIAAYAVGVPYKAGDIVSFKGQTFQVRSAHTSQSDWPPDAVLALYLPVTCTGAAPPAQQPPAQQPPAQQPPAQQPPPPPPAAGGITYAPYFFAFGWNNPAFPFRGLVDMKNKSGLKGATLAFVLARGGQCAATTDVFDNLADVKAFVSAGGRVRASFGGAFGTYLENACQTPQALAAVIIDFVNRTGIKELDFDVEQDAAENATINARRAQALKQVQTATGATISFTVPSIPRDKFGTPGGMPAKSVEVLKAVRAANVTVTYVSLMTMDFGGFFELNAQGQKRTMGEMSTSALADGQAQLSQIFGVSSAVAFKMLGVIPMIGLNDTPTEIFQVADVKTVADFAKQRGMGLVSYWGINRDQPGGSIDIANGIGAGVFAFNKAFADQGIK